MLVKRSMKVPKEMKNRFDEIAELITDFCNAKLNEEYRQICLQLCAALCRKRPSPLIGAKAPTWASGIIHTIGMVNFLFYSSSVFLRPAAGRNLVVRSFKPLINKF